MGDYTLSQGKGDGGETYTPVLLKRMIQHACWANKEMLDSLRRADPAPANLIALYLHVLSAERVWLRRLEGAEGPAGPVWPGGDLSGCEEAAAANEAGYLAYLEAADSAALGSAVHYRNSKGNACVSVAGDILAQVCLHGSYHRGQIAAALRQEGHVPASTDYIIFAGMS